MYSLNINKKVLNFINSFKNSNQIIDKISKLKYFKTEKILNLDIKRLKGQKISKEFYRLRIGDLRIIFEIIEKDKIIKISKVDYRGNIYS